MGVSEKGVGVHRNRLLKKSKKENLESRTEENMPM